MVTLRIKHVAQRYRRCLLASCKQVRTQANCKGWDNAFPIPETPGRRVRYERSNSTSVPVCPDHRPYIQRLQREQGLVVWPERTKS